MKPTAIRVKKAKENKYLAPFGMIQAEYRTSVSG